MIIKKGVMREQENIGHMFWLMFKTLVSLWRFSQFYKLLKSVFKLDFISHLGYTLFLKAGEMES